MMLGIGGGTWAGSGLLSQDADGRASLALGAALVVYAILGLTRIEIAVPPSWETWLSPLIGAVTGLVTAATGVFVVPAVPYLGALGLGKEDLVQALGLSFTASTLAIAGDLVLEGAIGGTLACASLLALAPALVGMLVGQRIRLWVQPATFRLCFFLGLLGLGTDQLARLLP